MGVPVTPDQQARRGLAARRRPDPRAPLRPRDQHADRLRRPRRRLRDPHRRGPPRDPLRDDDDRRHRRGAGDRRRAAGRGRGPLACRRSTATAAARGARAESSMTRRRFGRRLCEVAGEPRLRRLPGLLAARPRGARAASRASSTCSPRPSALGASGGGRPFLPRAISVADAGAGGGRRPARLPARGASGPGPSGSARSRRGRGSGSPARSATPSPRRARSRRAPPARSSSAAASGSRRWRCCAAGSRDRGVPTRVLLGFRDRAPLRRPRRPLLPAARGAAGHRGRPRRRTAATSPTCWRRCSRATTPPPPSSTPAARRRCWRRCGRSARERGVACELALESPMACGFGACFGCAVPLADGGYMRLCVDGPVRRAATQVAEVSAMPELLRHRARAPGDQRLRHLRRDRRRGASSATRCSSDFPFAAFVSKTITPEPRAGNAPRRIWETPAGMINSIGLPNKGLEGFLARGPAAAGRAAGAADRLGDGDEPRGVRAAASRRSASASEVAAIELNVSCPNVHSGLIVGEQPSETEALLEALRPLTDEAADREADAERRRPGGGRGRRRAGRRRRGLADQHAEGERDRPGDAASPARPRVTAASPARRCVRSPSRRCAPSPPRRDPGDRHGGICDGADALEFLAAGAAAGRRRNRELSRSASRRTRRRELVELLSLRT